MTRIPTRLIFLVALAAVGVVPRLAAAQAPPPPPPQPPDHGHAGFVVGLSIGYSAPAGDATSAAGDHLSGTFAFQVPLTLDLGVNILPSLFVGAYGTFADGGPGSALYLTCSQDNCQQMSFRGGVVVEYRFLPGRRFEPWIGYAFGYDATTASVTTVTQINPNPQQSPLQITNQLSARTLTGWDLGHVRTGLDFLTDPSSTAGIYADIGIGKFTEEWSRVAPEPGVNQSLQSPTLHEWITFGVRWTFMP